MIHRLIFLAGLLAMSSLALASVDGQEPSGTLAARAQASAEAITDARAFVLEVEQAVEMAGKGEYGRLKRGTMARIERARDTIRTLLDGHAHALELTPAERIELFNAQELITSSLNHDDKRRMVCKREPTIGSRVATTECLTVEERERRAAVARNSAQKVMRDVCYPGPGNRCRRD
jgi:hypothetical protein